MAIYLLHFYVVTHHMVTLSPEPYAALTSSNSTLSSLTLGIIELATRLNFLSLYVTMNDIHKERSRQENTNYIELYNYRLGQKVSDLLKCLEWLCDGTGKNLLEILDKTWSKVSQRDWVAYRISRGIQ